MRLRKSPKRRIFMVWEMANQLTSWISVCESWDIGIVQKIWKEVIIRMNIRDNIFIYDTIADICLLRQGKSIRELAIKGAIKHNGIVNGTWFQIDELVSHWISFREDKFNANKWEVFYKCVGDSEITHYRKVFYRVKGILVFSFSERNEWIKDPISGKWKNKQ